MAEADSKPKRGSRRTWVIPASIALIALAGGVASNLVAASR